MVQSMLRKDTLGKCSDGKLLGSAENGELLSRSYAIGGRLIEDIDDEHT